MNEATLAVAGSRKTQSIVDACTNGEIGVRRLVVTYTQSGQAELENRLRSSCAPGAVPEVIGWFAFLIRHCIRPYLPLHFAEQRLSGLNFHGNPPRGRYATGASRFFDSEGRAYRIHLSKLAYDVSNASSGAVVNRLANIFDEIYIDEVQDLTGCDLHLVDQLMEEPDLDVYMVGDVRQSVFDTNPQDPNLRQYRGVNMLDWFELYQTKGLLEVQHNAKTWRANQTIATFSDTLFPSEFTFEPTVSMQNETTDHDGVFALSEPDVPAYILQHSPQLLRNSISTVCALELPIHNFGKVKGLTFDRVLIYPTKSIINFLVDGTELAPKTACGLYVAVTRAKYSVAFVLPKPSDTALTHWGESNSPERASTT